MSDPLWPHRLQTTRLLLSLGFPRQEYWSGLPFPAPGNLPDPEFKPESPAWQADSLPLSHLFLIALAGKPFPLLFGNCLDWLFTTWDELVERYGLFLTWSYWLCMFSTSLLTSNAPDWIWCLFLDPPMLADFFFFFYHFVRLVLSHWIYVILQEGKENPLSEM